MHRRHLSQLLDRYELVWNEADIVARFRGFLSEHDDCLLRSCVPGHITASAWILAADGEAGLLTHHRKLERWLQLGGHVDGESRVELAALREAQEESGMRDFTFVRWSGDELTPLDSKFFCELVCPDLCHQLFIAFTSSVRARADLRDSPESPGRFFIFGRF